jgi:primosomal protein N' (replication factor Y)
LSARRPGVARIRADLVKMLGEPVAELTANSGDAEPTERVVVGTEAALHRVRDARIVAFLDIDDELTAPRYRAAEQAMSLLARAARLVGGRGDGGRIVVQSRLPRHPVLDAVLLADPSRLAAAELEQRRMLRFPPITAMAAVSGPVADEFIAALADSGRSDVDILGPADDRWLVRAKDHRSLCDALASVVRPPGRMRIEVDPLRV